MGRAISTVLGGTTTTSTYDRNGNRRTVTGPYPTAGPAAPLETTQDENLDRPTVVIANDVANPTLPTEDVTTTTYYDAAGHTVAGRDATKPTGITTRTIVNVRGLASQNAYDAGGRQQAVKDPVGAVTRTLYDANGQVQKTIHEIRPPSGWSTGGS